MRKLILSALALAMVAMLAAAQNDDMNIIGAGARAHGMGGAFIGVADDATAISWNPAGLAQLDRPEASAVGLFNSTTFEWEKNWDMPAISFDSTASGDEGVSHIAPNFFSLVLPVKMAERNLVFAVAYTRLIDFGWGFSDDSAGVETSIKQTGGLDAISPAIALQFSPKFSIGMAGNIIVNGTKVTTEVSSSSYNYKQEYTMKFSGFNFNTGVLVQPVNKFSLGVMARFPFTLTRKDKSEWSGTAGSGTWEDTEENKWTMPFMFGAGLAYKPVDKMTLAFDYERRNYASSEYEYGTVTGEDFWMNVNQFRVGMEYLFVGSSAVFPVRLGFRTNPQVSPAETYTQDASGIWTADSTVNNGYVFTGGFGLKLGRIWLDLAAEYGSTTIGKFERIWNDGDKYAYEEKAKSLSILTSCVVHF